MNAQVSTVPNYVLFCLAWEESEQGWGTRPDGFSLHVTVDVGRAYVKAHNDSLPDEVQSAYSRPTTGEYHLVEVSPSLYYYVKSKISQSLHMPDLETKDFRASLKTFDAVGLMRKDIQRLTKTVEEGLAAYQERDHLKKEFAEFLN